MRKSKIILALLLGMFVVFQSCEKKSITDGDKTEAAEDLTYADMPELEVKEGMLYFDNADEFFTTVEIIPNMTEEELDEWENKLGFTSVRTIQNKFYEELESFDEETVSEEDIRSLVERNNDYFEIIQDENGEEEIVEKIDIKSIRSICNSDNMIMTGDDITKFTDSYQISTNYSNINTLMKLNENDIENYKKNENYKVFQYLGNSSNKSNCGSRSTDFVVEKNVSGCRKDRKVKMFFCTYRTASSNSSGHTWNLYSYVKLYGQKKYACIWGGYKTNLNLKDMYYTVNYPTDYVFQGSQWILTDYSTSVGNWTKNESKEFVISKHLKSFFFYYDAIIPPPPYFKKYKGTFSSRGVGNNWGSGSCGY